MTATRLVNLIDAIRWGAIPQSAVERAKLAVLDYLGVLFAGMSMPLSSKMVDSLGGPGALGGADGFALWAGTVARAVDLDDGHRFAMGHPGVPVISAVLASTVDSRVTGPLFLEAVVRGYEVYGFLGRAINPPAYRERGFDSTGICGAVAAAAGVATAWRLEAKEMAHAAAIAGSLCGGLTQYFEDGSSPKYLCSGWAANLGVKAAVFARHGFTGPDSIFGGKSGFCQAFSPRYDLEHLKSAGVRWEIEHSYFKKFGCVRRTHAALDCVEAICSAHGLSVGDISRIIVRCGRFVADGGKYSPKDIVAAQSSVPFSIAVLLCAGDVDLELLERSIGDPVVDEVSRRVEIVEDDEFNELARRNPSYWNAAAVDITDTKGATYSHRVDLARGEAENPFDSSTLQEKYVRLACKVMDEVEAREIMSRVMSLEDTGDVGQAIAGPIRGRVK